MIALLPWHTASLRELIARGEKLPHALLVHGRAGIGKVEFARAAAQSLLCEAREDHLACGACAACKWFSDGNHPDYREVFPDALGEDEPEEEGAETDSKDKKKSREIKIDQVRAIADFMAVSTHRDGYRVLVIHPAEAMNLAAANALLKTLEEPSARTVIFLVSDQLGRLLATIRSRCQRVLVPAPDNETALAWLQAQKLANAADALAAAGGAPLDAIAYADPDYQSARRAFVAALGEPRMDFSETAQHFEKADLSNVLYWLQTWVQDLILVGMGATASHHRDQARALSRIAAQARLPAVFRYETELRKTRRLINHPLNARLLLEQLLIGYMQAIKAAR